MLLPLLIICCCTFNTPSISHLPLCWIFLAKQLTAAIPFNLCLGCQESSTLFSSHHWWRIVWILPVSPLPPPVPHRMLPRVCEGGPAKPTTLLVCSRSRGKVTSRTTRLCCPTSGMLSWDTGVCTMPTGHSIVPNSAAKPVICPMLRVTHCRSSPTKVIELIYFTRSLQLPPCWGKPVPHAGAQHCSLRSPLEEGWWEVLTAERVGSGSRASGWPGREPGPTACKSLRGPDSPVNTQQGNQDEAWLQGIHWISDPSEEVNLSIENTDLKKTLAINLKGLKGIYKQWEQIFFPC